VRGLKSDICCNAAHKERFIAQNGGERHPTIAFQPHELPVFLSFRFFLEEESHKSITVCRTFTIEQVSSICTVFWNSSSVVRFSSNFRTPNHPRDQACGSGILSAPSAITSTVPLWAFWRKPSFLQTSIAWAQEGPSGSSHSGPTTLLAWRGMAIGRGRFSSPAQY
jgi:hypothetical protein